MSRILSNNNPSLTSKQSLDDYIAIQLHKLLTTCHCSHVSGTDYELEVASHAVNGLVGDEETADVYLYAAIERNDWAEVLNIYQTVFRPYIIQVANEQLIKVLCI